MTGNTGRQFVDASVLVYAFDASSGTKKEQAERLLNELWESGTGCLSVQVLQEFFVTVTRKLSAPLVSHEAAERVADFASWKVFAPTAQDVVAAIGLHREAQIGFWDAMVVHAASEAGCDVLWTEDLAHGQVLRGVRIMNPFGGR